ncbi:Tripartite tricarboxylate transporter family receptor [Pigmentiphaga humi]|uniref:Tripartite tricarboxylate transporter family receptor n=1 Tax=Pigmentiphaga humi TaxID=2478468 RepID=A0A3P4AWT8_9BURK|nr:tripartite tricarboxylate transporter substrate binding protein [Pigmentiphaga humi]VCU68507.1 Tripartite tricarboxylate transporter family receptor [Pigmentiphaga humi]
MKHPFIKLFAPMCVSLSFCMTAAASAAEAYPSHPVRIVDAFPPGGSTDVLARYLASKTAEEWGQPVIVENKPGAAGQIGMGTVAKAPADGYTLMILPNEIWSVTPLLYKNLPFNIGRELTPVASVATVPIVMTVGGALPVSSVSQFIEYARSWPGKVSFGSAGAGTLHHLSAELFKSMAGIDMLHVPYRGTAPAVADLLGGQIQVVFSPISAVLPHIQAGKLKALAVTGARRSAALPAVPTVAEAGLPGYESNLWVNLIAPAGTPAAVIQKWNEQARRVMSTAEARDKLMAQGIEPAFDTPANLVRRLDEDAARWRRVIETSRISVE